jgi:hypothetical protein
VEEVLEVVVRAVVVLEVADLALEFAAPIALTEGLSAPEAYPAVAAG